MPIQAQAMEALSLKAVSKTVFVLAVRAEVIFVPENASANQGLAADVIHREHIILLPVQAGVPVRKQIVSVAMEDLVVT